MVQIEKIPLADLLKKANGDVVSFGGIVFEVQQIQEVPCRDGKARRKQVVSVVDESYLIGQITLWEGFAGCVDSKEGEAALTTVMVDDRVDAAYGDRLSSWWKSPAAESDFAELNLPTPV